MRFLKSRLFLIFLLALVLRGIFALVPFYEVDSLSYLLTAESLKIKDFSDPGIFYWPPLYPFLIYLLGGLKIPLAVSAGIISVFCGALLVFPIFLLAKRTAGERVAEIAALLTALYPHLIYYSAIKRTESLYLLVFFCGVYFLYLGCLDFKAKKADFYLGISALFWGLSCLSRFEGLAGAVLAFALLAGKALFSKPAGNFKAPAWFLLIFSLVVLPYQSLLLKQGSFLVPRAKIVYDQMEASFQQKDLTFSDFLFFFGLPGEKSSRELEAAARQFSLPAFKYSFSGALKALPEIIKSIFANCCPLFLLLFFLDFHSIIRRRENRFLLSFLLLILPVSLATFFWDINPRYFAVVIPILILLISPALSRLGENQPRWVYQLVFLGMVFSLIQAFPDALYPTWFYFKSPLFLLGIVLAFILLFYQAKILDFSALKKLLLFALLFLALQNLGAFYYQMSKYAFFTNFSRYIPLEGSSLMAEAPWNARLAGKKWIKPPNYQDLGDFRKDLYRQKPDLILAVNFKNKPPFYPYYAAHLNKMLEWGELAEVKSENLKFFFWRAELLLYRPTYSPAGF